VTERLTKVLFDSWIGVTKSSEDYLANTTDFSVEPVDSSVSSAKQLVYLTSDAEETLQTLDSNCVYIIGGIVDRNRLKGATYNKAKLQGVRTAKLPIKENFAMACTHILTVNHVYEILLNYAQDGNWTSAIERVIPKRKGLEQRVAGGGGEEEDNASLADEADTAENDDNEAINDAVDVVSDAQDASVVDSVV
jgi:tRNA (guanine9-N1)-methyltransferase